jgi:hypothetical protein
LNVLFGWQCVKYKKDAYIGVFYNLIWWNIGDANGTLEERVKKPATVIASIDDDIRKKENFH